MALYADVQDLTTYHVRHFQVAIGENDSIWGRGHRKHEGKGSTQSAGDHDVQRVQANRLGL